MKQKIKLCGINNLEILDFIINYHYQPDFLGFVFYGPSPRSISFSLAKKFNNLISSKIKKVAVTVNASTEYLNLIKDSLEPDIFQLHGEENASYIKNNFDKEKIIKAIPLNNKSDLKQIAQYQDLVDYLLFDSKVAGYGGSGISFNWNLLDNLSLKIPYFLSGGLNINNLDKAISSRCNFFDLSSGIELQKGVKDRKKIAEILDLFRKVNEK